MNAASAFGRLIRILGLAALGLISTGAVSGCDTLSSMPVSLEFRSLQNIVEWHPRHNLPKWADGGESIVFGHESDDGGLYIVDAGG